MPVIFFFTTEYTSFFVHSVPLGTHHRTVYQNKSEQTQDSISQQIRTNTGQYTTTSQTEQQMSPKRGKSTCIPS